MTTHELMQQHFTTAYAGLASQGFERSVRSNDDACLYRAPDGRKCAVGHILPDEAISMNMNGGSIGDLTSVNNLADEILFGDSSYDEMGNFLNDLQDAHDSAYTPDAMRSNLRAVATYHHLTVPEVDA